ncbi:MAG: hypothetical protein AAGF12_05085 [Myxococcota bacterium]
MDGRCERTSSECVRNAECGTGETCVEGRCVNATGACVRNAECNVGQICLDGNCVSMRPDGSVDGSPDSTPDAPIPPGDAGPCVDGDPCDTGNACELGVIRCESGQPSCVAAGVVAAATVCRPSAGVCDVEELCDGVDPQCPPDEKERSGTVCRPTAGPCDRMEACDGSSDACPADAFEGPARACRVSTDPCNPTEVCPGDSAQCPSDVRLPDGAVCGMNCPPDFGPCTTVDCTSAMRARTCTELVCGGGTCGAGRTFMDTMSCSVRNGMACATCGTFDCVCNGNRCVR